MEDNVGLIHRLVEMFLTAAVCVCIVMPTLAAAQQPEIAATAAFIEGPTVDREGNVYFSDIINQRIMNSARLDFSPSTANTATWPTVC
jgi:sugar lactone lactonase YvrE